MSAAVATIGRAQRRAPVLQFVALIALFIYGAATISGFSASTSIRSMLVLAALLGLAALGQTIVMIVGGLDLSIPGFIVAGAILVSQLCGTHHWAFVPAFALILVIAAAMGAISGWICHRYRIQPLIVTLGVGALASGGCLAWTGGKLTGSAPAFLGTLTSPAGTTFGVSISPVVVIWAVVAIAVGLVLHRTVPGRRLYATGANPRAADLARVNTSRVWTVVFAASAVCSAVVGVLLAGFSGADQTLGDPYLFQGLTAVIVGGTTIMGSRGDYTHTVLGALILTELTTILVGHGYDTADQQIIFGVLILIVVAGYGRDRRLRDTI
jgi:ribose transport system permease protein